MVIENDQKITAEVDTKAKIALTLYEKMLSFFTMIKGQTENGND